MFFHSWLALLGGLLCRKRKTTLPHLPSSTQQLFGNTVLCLGLKTLVHCRGREKKNTEDLTYWVSLLLCSASRRKKVFIKCRPSLNVDGALRLRIIKQTQSHKSCHRCVAIDSQVETTLFKIDFKMFFLHFKSHE